MSEKNKAFINVEELDKCVERAISNSESNNGKGPKTFSFIDPETNELKTVNREEE